LVVHQQAARRIVLPPELVPEQAREWGPRGDAGVQLVPLGRQGPQRLQRGDPLNRQRRRGGDLVRPDVGGNRGHATGHYGAYCPAPPAVRDSPESNCAPRQQGYPAAARMPSSGDYLPSPPEVRMAMFLAPAFLAMDMTSTA